MHSVNALKEFSLIKEFEKGVFIPINYRTDNTALVDGLCDQIYKSCWLDLLEKRSLVYSTFFVWCEA